MTTTKIHPFERTGLGKAPFKFVGMEIKVGPIRLADGITEVGSPGQPMGTCDHCGTGIKYCCHIKSSDGNYFIVGTDCVLQTHKDSCTTEDDKLQEDVRREKRKLDRELRHAREAKKLEEGNEWVRKNNKLLSMIESDRKGQSLLDQFNWYRQNAGVAGNLRILKKMMGIVKENGDAIQKMIDANETPDFLKDQLALEAERMAELKVAEEKRKVVMALAQQRNAPLIKVLLLQKQTGFISAMIEKLTKYPINAFHFSPRTVDILGDIYAKAHGRRNSKAYNAALVEFDENIVLEEGGRGTDIAGCSGNWYVSRAFYFTFYFRIPSDLVSIIPICLLSL